MGITRTDPNVFPYLILHHKSPRTAPRPFLKSPPEHTGFRVAQAVGHFIDRQSMVLEEGSGQFRLDRIGDLLKGSTLVLELALQGARGGVKMLDYFI